MCAFFSGTIEARLFNFDIPMDNVLMYRRFENRAHYFCSSLFSSIFAVSFQKGNLWHSFLRNCVSYYFQTCKNIEDERLYRRRPRLIALILLFLSMFLSFYI